MRTIQNCLITCFFIGGTEMNYITEFEKWNSHEAMPHELILELKKILENPKKVEDHFYQYLSFGTGGMRGLLGVGTNRMNIYTIRRVAEGLAKHINSSEKEAMGRGVVIAYDTRHYSYEFALETAKTLGKHNIQVYLFKESRPTPELSFAIRQLNAFAGVVITASHNPAEYNGFKVYGEDGGQLPPEAADCIIEYMDEIEDLFAIQVCSEQELIQSKLLKYILEEIDVAYQKCLITLKQDEKLLENADNLSIVYTPLHGSGLVPVQEGLKHFGFTKLSIVKEQSIQDGSFPTISFPNPEEREAFEMAIELGKLKQADLLLATDPDADRLGVAVKLNNGEYKLLTGNQLGALLLNYLLNTKYTQGTLPKNGLMMKTIVTSELGRHIATKYGVETHDTLTGFKFISEKIEELTQTKDHEFLFGYEESYGYLIGTFARDKDAVQTALLTAEMALYYKSKGKTLEDGLFDLYEEFGHYREGLKSITLEGKHGQEQIIRIVDQFRKEPPSMIGGIPVSSVEDYQYSKKVFKDGTTQQLILPQANVLKLLLEDGSWICIRPSGTEPKCKFYFGVRKVTSKEAERTLGVLMKEIMSKVQ